MMKALSLSDGDIPDMEKVSDRLETITRWRVVLVAGLVPDEVFFNHLGNRRFPVGAFIRPEEELDYLQDIFGHVPLLANSERCNSASWRIWRGFIGTRSSSV
jgi:phenylalanine-4-hydroxylase